MAEPFTWRDGERTIRFGRGVADHAVEHVGNDYTLLTTPRHAALAAPLHAAAATVAEVPDGEVGDAAAALLDRVGGGDQGALVALGGGRVIDTAKALGAATGRPVTAIPTTLSAAEMTRLHRPIGGRSPAPTPVRPRLVLNDPALSASQPPAELAASAANALGHAVEAQLTTAASPVPTLAARAAVGLIEAAYGSAEPEPDRDSLALAALLSGYAIDSAWYGLHHVMAQTLRAHGPVSHGQANAALLPHTIAALAGRGAVPEGSAELAALLAAAAGATQLAPLGVDDALLDTCAEAAAARPELANTPPLAGRDELRAIYAAAL